MAIDDENKDFMALMGSWRGRVMLQVALSAVNPFALTEVGLAVLGSRLGM